MSEAYDLYLKEHVAAVQKSWDWIKENIIPEIREWVRDEYSIYSNNSEDIYLDPIDIFEIDDLIKNHDASKIRPEEYYPYDTYFYGGNRTNAVVTNFNRAFLLHIHENPHHWQYWVLISDDPDKDEKLIEIPLSYIFEMICDWWSFSWRKNDLEEIFAWWDEHKDYIHMERKSRKTVEKILNTMKDILMKNNDNADDVISHSDDEDKEDENKFGIPELKKFPMPDKKHVKSAIRFFNYVDPKHEKELAEAILERMKEYGMSFDDFEVGDVNRFKKYIPEEEQKEEK